MNVQPVSYRNMKLHEHIDTHIVLEEICTHGHTYRCTHTHTHHMHMGVGAVGGGGLKAISKIWFHKRGWFINFTIVWKGLYNEPLVRSQVTDMSKWWPGFHLELLCKQLYQFVGMRHGANRDLPLEFGHIACP